MSASAYILQLVRAHYAGDERQFRSTALTLAHKSKLNSIRESIDAAVRAGASARHSATKPRPVEDMQPMRVLAGGMLEQLEPVTLAELQLPEAIQRTIEDVTTELEYRHELAKRGLRPRNRLLLWGPPGCGKTSLARAMASALDVPAFGVSLPRLIDKYIGATGQNLGQLFGQLRPNTLVVFDELDAVGAARVGNENAAGKEFNGIVNTMLTLLDRSTRGIIVATTNRRDIVDPALLRRFDEQIEVPAPSEAQMRALAQRLSDGYGVAAPRVDGCSNYDEVTKHVQREARRIVMAEILAAEEVEEDGEEEAG